MGSCISCMSSTNSTQHVTNHNTSKTIPPAIDTNYAVIKRQQPTPVTIPSAFSSDSLRIHLLFNDCNLATCAALSRLQYILSHQESDIACYGPYELINHHLNEYNNVQLLDDYHHLLSVHDDEFEDIYNKLSCCALHKCSAYTRNHRDRSSSNSRKAYNVFLIETDNKTTDIIKEINTMQIIDTIHCYFLHTFDALFRLNREDQNKLNKQMELMLQKEKETDKEETDHISIESDDNDEEDTATTHYQQTSLRVRAMSQHMEEVKHIAYGGANRRGSRFTRSETQIRSKYCRLERQLSRNKSQIITDDEETNVKTNANQVAYNADNDIVYSFGVRFIYDKSKKHEEWFVKQKYRSLKDELVSNEWKAFGIEEWDEIYQKATDFAQTRRIKEMYVFKDTGDVIGGTVPDVISVDHLLSVMVYCNFDKLQTKFSESYRRLDGESAADLKQKHSEWHQLGKFLREAVEYFGKRISSEERRISSMIHKRRSSDAYSRVKLKFFHGINKQMVFVSTSARICGPLSTSCEPLVALQFAGSDGLLLELTGSHARFFECCGISDYSNEKEALFVGGYDPLLIYTVINPKTIDYRKYIKAINIISCLFNGAPYYGPSKKPFNKSTIKRVYGLMFFKHEANKHVIEPYVERLFTHYTENVTEVVIDWKLMNMEHDEIDKSIKGFRFIKNMICMKTFNWIKMNRIQILFQHLQIIQLNYIKLTKQVMDYILHILDRNKEKPLPLGTIIIYQPLQRHGLNIQDALAIYADSFRQKVRWYMYSKNNINLVIKKLNN